MIKQGNFVFAISAGLGLLISSCITDGSESTDAMVDAESSALEISSSSIEVEQDTTKDSISSEGISSSEQGSSSSVGNLPNSSFNLPVETDGLVLRMRMLDFQPVHADFENFDAQRGMMQPPQMQQCGMLPGDTVTYTSEILEAVETIYGTNVTDTLMNTTQYFGEFHKGTFDGIEINMNSQVVAGTSWKWLVPVFASRGMTQSQLVENAADPLATVPASGSLRCDASLFDTWFTQIPSVNHLIDSVMILEPGYGSDGSPLYKFDSRDLGGFFPLDQFDGDASKPNFGKQNLGTWCPAPFFRNTITPEPIEDQQTCDAFWANYDSVTGSAPVVATSPGAHNYNFTVHLYGEFTYEASSYLYIHADDDTWVYLDGKLVVDLGGTHAPAEAAIDIGKYSNSEGWVLGSQHTLHIFHAERQTAESIFAIYTNLQSLGAVAQ